jgi:hypothetical protein
VSHITPIKRDESYDVPTLERMCRQNGWEFIRGQKQHKYYGGYGACDHAIRIPGCSYEIGVKEGEKTELMWDSFSSGGLGQALGQNGWKLNQSYDMTKSLMTAEMNGHWYSETELNQTDIQKVGNQAGWKKAVVTLSGGW